MEHSGMKLGKDHPPCCGSWGSESSEFGEESTDGVELDSDTGEEALSGHTMVGGGLAAVVQIGGGLRLDRNEGVNTTGLPCAPEDVGEDVISIT